MVTAGQELQRIQTRSMQLGGWGCGYHVVNGLKQVQHAHSMCLNGWQEYTENIEGVVSLLAHRDDGKIVFGHQESWFPTLTAQADNGMFVHSNLKTYKGDLQLDADLNEDNCTETTPPVCRHESKKMRQHVVAFAGGLTIQAKKLMSLGGVWESPKQPWDEEVPKKVKKVSILPQYCQLFRQNSHALMHNALMIAV